MSPKSVATVIFWFFGLAALFTGFFAWGRYVESRDRARLSSDILTLQRGDLPDGFRVAPLDITPSSIQGTMLTATGAQSWSAVDVLQRQNPGSLAQVYYLHYDSVANAEKAEKQWRETLGLGKEGTDPAITSRGQVAAIRSYGTVIVIAQSRNNNDALASMRTILDAAEARIKRAKP